MLQGGKEALAHHKASPTCGPTTPPCGRHRIGYCCLTLFLIKYIEKKLAPHKYKGIRKKKNPMRRIFGFVDEYSKVTYGMRDTLQLIREDDNDALFRTAVAGAGKVVLSNLGWYIPIVQPNDVRQVNLYKRIATNNAIPVSFRIRQSDTSSLHQARSNLWRLGVSFA